MNLVFDIETDGLDPHKIFCISAMDVDTQEQKNFDVSNICNGLAYLMQADKLIGHNIIGFDIPAIKKLYRVDLSDKKIVDTLVLSRLFNPVRASHSLEAWGYKLGFQKIDFDKYDKYSEEMMEYCANDVQLNLKVYEALKRESKGFTSESVNLERDTYKVITKQREHGFMLDVTLAMQLLEEFEKEIKLTEKEVHKTFKPRIDRRVIYPQHTKDGVLRKMGLDTKGKQTRLTDDEYDIFDKGQSIDASGLELRMLAHYLNDEEFTDDIINGDIHTANQKRAGLKSRNQAKTFIYAFLYGAGDAKIGSVIGGNKAEGKRVKQSFLANFGTLKTFRNRITREAEQNGFIKGLDGRKIFIRSAHAALNSLLQGAGAIVMKRALVIFDELIKENNLLANCVANVHDEWQVEVLEKEAEQLGQLGVDAIRAAGVYYNLNCPLDGEYKIGGNWSETH
jgi:DNA polymerase I-like protein with 3'-5' exonuclease and polymerase domains